MKELFHELISIWFHWLNDWGYVGVFVLMAIESTTIPIPSEMIIPPAAFWASQGKMNIHLVVLAGTLGSYLGSVLSYYVCYILGEPILKKFGKYIGFNDEKLKFAQIWLSKYGFMGIFVSRLLPVLRHVISMPAGALKMKFSTFSIATIVGAGIWCYVLAWFGQELLGEHPGLLNSPQDLIHVMKEKLQFIVLGILVFAALYGFVIWKKKSLVRES